MTKQERKNRNIRLNDDEWTFFKIYMGAKWLRLEIKLRHEEEQAISNFIEKSTKGKHQ